MLTTSTGRDELLVALDGLTTLRVRPRQRLNEGYLNNTLALTVLRLRGLRLIVVSKEIPYNLTRGLYKI